MGLISMMKSIKNYIESHRLLAGLGGALIALVVAAVYFIVVPDRAEDVEGIAKIILLYGHSVCWVLIAQACTLWAFGRGRLGGLLLYVALAVYAIFLVSLIL